MRHLEKVGVQHSTEQSESNSRGIPHGFSAVDDGGEFIVRNGPLYLETGVQGLRLGFRVEERHANPFGTCHGGMLTTFCDMLLPWVAQRTSESLSRRFLPTISLQVDFLAPAPVGAWVEGGAEILRETRQLIFMQGLVRADGRLAARASGVFRIGQPFP